MYLTRLFAPAGLAFTMLIGAAVSDPPGASGHARTPASIHRAGAAEIQRVRAHLDSVLAELGARDLHGLTTAQRARRTALVTTLWEYRDRGVFPHNYDFPGRAVPYFVDRKTGTLCAVAHLLVSTGRSDIVQRVTRTNNNVYVAQLEADTALAAWLDTNGLTLLEAERIQVVYAAPPLSPMVIAGLVAAPVALGGSIATSIWNATGNSDGHRRFGNVVGLASGIVTAGIGIGLMAQPAAPRQAGEVAMLVGSLSVALATRSIIHHHGAVLAQREAERNRVVGEASIVPLLATGGKGSGAGAGLAVSIRF